MSDTGTLTAKDFQTDQEVRWCPGCGDYSILKQVHTVLPQLGIPREDIVVISGIGCSSRFPYYTNTFGMHSIHGRATAIASGLKASRPELSVWIVTGDGDGLSIGGNHMIHILRRNFDVNILLFNNEIYGLTKGQYSPTSPVGKVAKSTPMGSIDHPFNPAALALGADATFVARSMDRDPQHLQSMLLRANQHHGASFLEIYQNCNIFNNGAFSYATEKDTKDDTRLILEHGKPLIFGKDREKGIRLNCTDPEIVALGEGVSEDDLLFHDEKAAEPSLAYLLSRMHHPHFPEPFGVFRAVERPCYEYVLDGLCDATPPTEAAEDAEIDALLNAGETWTVD